MESRVKMETRNLVSLAAVILAAALFAGAMAGCPSGKQDGDRDKRLAEIKERVESQELLKRFEALPERAQQSIITRLDEQTLGATAVAKTLNQLHKRVRVPQFLDSKLEYSRYYNLFNNTIHYKPLTLPQQARLYLEGVPAMFFDGHERTHAVQDAASKWDDFETFCTSVEFEIDGEDVVLPEHKAALFARDMLKKPYTPYKQSLREFNRRFEEYKSTRPERILLWEMDAFLTFEPYLRAGELYDRMDKVGLFYEESLDSVPREMFDQAYQSMIELFGMKDPIDVAGFVGANGESVDGFIERVDALKDKERTKDANARGVKRMARMKADLEDIVLTTARLIDLEYEKAGSPPIELDKKDDEPADGDTAGPE